ncbi:hypothetical protein BVX98_01255, partial [bacterium F11]
MTNTPRSILRHLQNWNEIKKNLRQYPTSYLPYEIEPIGNKPGVRVSAMAKTPKSLRLFLAIPHWVFSFFIVTGPVLIPAYLILVYPLVVSTSSLNFMGMLWWGLSGMNLLGSLVVVYIALFKRRELLSKPWFQIYGVLIPFLPVSKETWMVVSLVQSGITLVLGLLNWTSEKAKSESDSDWSRLVALFKKSAKPPKSDKLRDVISADHINDTLKEVWDKDFGRRFPYGSVDFTVSRMPTTDTPSEPYEIIINPDSALRKELMGSEKIGAPLFRVNGHLVRRLKEMYPKFDDDVILDVKGQFRRRWHRKVRKYDTVQTEGKSKYIWNARKKKGMPIKLQRGLLEELGSRVGKSVLELDTKDFGVDLYSIEQSLGGMFKFHGKQVNENNIPKTNRWQLLEYLGFIPANLPNLKEVRSSEQLEKLLEHKALLRIPWAYFLKENIVFLQNLVTELASLVAHGNKEPETLARVTEFDRSALRSKHYLDPKLNGKSKIYDNFYYYFDHRSPPESIIPIYILDQLGIPNEKRKISQLFSWASLLEANLLGSFRKNIIAPW